jgi:VanZ family protein
LFFYHVFKEKHVSFKEIFSILILCLTYGIIIEVLQHLFVDSRQADILDVLANTIGIIIGTIVYWKAKNRIKT